MNASTHTNLSDLQQFALSQRDSEPLADSLCSVLSMSATLRHRNPSLSESLLETARSLAAKIGYLPRATYTDICNSDYIGQCNLNAYAVGA